MHPLLLPYVGITTAKEEPMGLYEQVDQDVLAVFKRWADRSAEYYERSAREFEERVRPAAYYVIVPRPGDVEFANICFTEWFLYEFALREGKSPLMWFVERPPARTPAERIRRLGQVAETQRFSQFAILDKHPKTREVDLADLCSGRELRVTAPMVCGKGGWKDGSVGIRIACVDGQWISVGKAVLYDRNPGSVVSAATGFGVGHDEGEGSSPDEARPSGSREGDVSFLGLVREVIGLGGAYAGTRRMVGVGRT